MQDRVHETPSVWTLARVTPEAAIHSIPLSFPGSTSESSVVENTLSVYEAIIAFMTPVVILKLMPLPGSYLLLVTWDLLWMKYGSVKPVRPRRKRSQGWGEETRRGVTYDLQCRSINCELKAHNYNKHILIYSSFWGWGMMLFMVCNKQDLLHSWEQEDLQLICGMGKG